MLQPFVISADPLPFTPETLKSDLADKKDPVFYITPLSQLEEERMGYELFRHGINPMAEETYRAYFVQEVLAHYGDKGDEMCDLLEEMWQANDVHENNMALWEAQEDQNRIDEARGVVIDDRQAMPKHPMSMARRAQATLIADEVQRASQKMRDLHVEKATYPSMQRRGMARILISGWDNIDVPYEREDGIIPQATYSALVKKVGKVAQAEIENYCLSSSIITGRERGNSDSPPESGSSLNGSAELKEGLEISNGSSTSAETPIQTESVSSDTEPLQESTSAPTTGESSTSTSASTGATESKDEAQPETSQKSPSG